MDDPSRDPGPATEDDALDDWLEDDAPPRRAGFTMRHPVLLLAVLAGAVFMAVRSWPGTAYMLRARTPAECGSITERPRLRAEDPQAVPPLPHDTYCHVSGAVQLLTTLATGQARDLDDPYRRDEGRRFFVKLAGDNVFAVLAADRKDVVNHRLRKGSLFGFQIDEPGRMIDPDREPGYAGTARTLRLKFSIPDSEPIRIFDTTDQPSSRWHHAAALIAMVFTALLALFGLVRVIRRRREG